MLVGGKRRKNHSKKLLNKSIKNYHYKKNKRSKKRNFKKLKKTKKQSGGSTELGNAYNAGGLLSTGYTLNNISPNNLALANPIPINTYSKSA